MVNHDRERFIQSESSEDSLGVSTDDGGVASNLDLLCILSDRTSNYND